MDNQKVTNEKFVKYLKIIVVVVVVALFLWFLVLHPLFTFRGYEKETELAAKRYYEINERELPTGTRVKTLSIQELFNQAYLKDDFYVPFSKKPCSIKDSWVKVRQEDGEYKYYTYLKCGVISSNVDHKGPEIILNGDSEVTVNLGSKYKDAGVKSVVDNTDGKIDVSNVKIDSSAVNTNKAGTYKVTYRANDSLNNTNEVTRVVNVVSRLKNTVEKATNNTGIYQGASPNNYIYFSGMLFRIVDIDGSNVRIVAEQDVSNVNYNSIDAWLEYYYKHITKDAKKYVVENKYCDMKITDDTIFTSSECSSYSNKKVVSILSNVDYNHATDQNGDNYLYPASLSWMRNEKDETSAYGVRSFFYGTDLPYMSFDKNYNFGVRPVITIKGNALVVSGDGTMNHPYSIGDFETGEVGEKVNQRQSGEYISYSGLLWRIVESQKDGTTKVIADDTVYNEDVLITAYYDTSDTAKVYNPKQKGNIGYFINNEVSKYIKSDYFVNKEIEVPIYKRAIRYGDESDTKTYKVKFSAPNIYEMFTAFDFHSKTMKSYWFINSSKKANMKAVMAEIGTVRYDDIYDYSEFGIRPVGYLDEDCQIVRGNGTVDNPYIIKK